jgi:hypothetical protein
MRTEQSYVSIPCSSLLILLLELTRFFMAAIFSSDFDDAFTLIYSFMAV